MLALAGLGENLIKVISDIYANQVPVVSSDATVIAGYVRVASGCGALIYIFWQLVTKISTNKEIDFLPFLRPFIVWMVIYYSADIANAIDGIGNQVRSQFTNSASNISTQIKEVNAKMKEKVDQKWQEIRNNPEAYRALFGTSYEDDTSGIFGETLTNLKITIAQAQESMKYQLWAFLQDLLLAIMFIAEAILLLLSIMFRLVLRMGFPIAVALTIFPGFTGNLVHWAGKYLNFALLPAVAAMYSKICFGLILTYLNNYSSPNALAEMGAEAAQPEYLGLAFIAILFMCLLGYLQVPSMCEMLISIGGVSAITAVATRNAAIGTYSGIQTGSGIVNSAVNAANKVDGYVSAGHRGAIEGAKSGYSISKTGGNSTIKSVVSGAFIGSASKIYEKIKGSK
ncbi:MAG: hypothetical protein V4683_15500 [Bacteroidota bacterium]